MKKNIFLPIVFIAILSSCTTTSYVISHYAEVTENLTVLQHGKITHRDAVESEKNTIFIDGAIYDSSAGFISWMLSKGHTVKRTWEGMVHDNNARHTVAITCFVDNEEGDSGFYPDGEDNVTSDAYFSVGGISDFEITGLSQSYAFETVSPPSDMKWFYEKDFPIRYMDFYIDGRQFSILLTTMHGVIPLLGNKSPMEKYDDAFLHNEQVFQIVDEEGLVYAEFTPSYLESVIALKYFFQGYERRDGTYSIFDVSSDFDETKIVPVIAIIDIMKYIIQYSESQ